MRTPSTSLYCQYQKVSLGTIKRLFTLPQQCSQHRVHIVWPLFSNRGASVAIVIERRQAAVSSWWHWPPTCHWGYCVSVSSCCEHVEKAGLSTTTCMWCLCYAVQTALEICVCRLGVSWAAGTHHHPRASKLPCTLQSEGIPAVQTGSQHRAALGATGPSGERPARGVPLPGTRRPARTPT